MPPQVTRLLMIFGVLVLLFVGMRWFLRPPSFYQYGHYRGAALSEAIQRTPAYVPRTSCAECHEEEVTMNAAGPHSKVNCQICHGSGAQHIEDPTTENIQRPEVRAICLRCHEQRGARPKWMPQIVEADHADGAKCSDCHTVHNPAEMKE
jgi:hypothetical protein